MILSVTKNQPDHYWNMFAQSGDPQMYLKYKQNSKKKKAKNENN